MRVRTRSLLLVVVVSPLVPLAFACVGDEADPNDASALADSSADQNAAETSSSGDSSTPSDGGLSDSSDASDGGDNLVKQISMGRGFGCAVLNSGSVWCWGNNASGQVKSPLGGLIATPTQIVGLTDATYVSAGLDSACAVRADNTVWCWGNNGRGQLGHAPGTGADVTCGGNKFCGPAPAKVDTVQATRVSIGFDSACSVLDSYKLVVCWGGNGSGQLGRNMDISFDPLAPSGVARDSSAVLYTDVVVGIADPVVCAIDVDSKVWCWGRNKYGQLGHAAGTQGDQLNCGSTAPAGEACNSKAQKVTLFEDGGGGDLSNIAHVAPGAGMCASQLGGGVYCWGNNQLGQFGNGTAVSSVSPIQIAALTQVKTISGDNAKCALKMNGDVYCWGLSQFQETGSYGNDAGCTGFTGTVQPCQVNPTKIALANVIELSAGGQGFAGMALTGNHEVFAWGGNLSGALGHAVGTNGDDTLNNNPTPVKVQGLP